MDIPAPPRPEKIVTVAAAALIKDERFVLIAERPAGKELAGYWELPGGKLDTDERAEDALIRELKEELGISVGWGCLQPFTFVSHAYDHFHLIMPVFAVRQWSGAIMPIEHKNHAWVRPSEMRNYNLAPADLPLIPLLHDYLRTR